MGLGEPHVDGGPRCDISGEPSLESSRDTFLDSRDTFSECSRSPGKITAVASLHSASSASRCLSASVISAAIRGVRLAGFGEPRVIIYGRAGVAGDAAPPSRSYHPLGCNWRAWPNVNWNCCTHTAHSHKRQPSTPRQVAGWHPALGPASFCRPFITVGDSISPLLCASSKFASSPKRS